MIETRIKAMADLNGEIRKTYLNTLFATDDNAAHTIDVEVVRDGDQVSLDKATVSAYFIRYSDNATVTLEGSCAGNVASITLNKSCYNKAGQFALIIKATLDGAISTVFYGEGSIYHSRTDTIVDEENVVPSLEDLLAQIATMEEGTDAANAAAASATTAANRANNAAQAIEGMTVSAESTTAPSVVISDVNGARHIKFGLVTPDITFEVATGAEGTNVQVEQSGTAEAPIVKLTIPRGYTGSIDNLPVATASEVGGVMVGDGLTMTDGVLSIAVGDGLTITDGALCLALADGDEVMY